MSFIRRLLTLLDPDFEGDPVDTELEKARDTLRAVIGQHNVSVAAAASRVEALESRVAERKQLAVQSRADARGQARRGRVEASARASERAQALRREIDALRYDVREARLAYHSVIEARDSALREARGRIEALRKREAEGSEPEYLELTEDIVVSAAEDALQSVKPARDGLAEFEGHPALGRFAARGLDQIGSLQHKRDSFLQLLARKLSPTELTFSRYAGALEQVCLQVLGNLADITDALGIADDIDAVELEQRIEALEAQPEPSEADRRESQALRARRDLRGVQLARVDALLAENEEALTTLVNALAAVADMRALERQADPRMQTVMRDLEALARRAKQYG